jgi:peptidoglycan/xylan/chitin deacetylase (PgdA/CDA1 family)
MTRIGPHVLQALTTLTTEQIVAELGWTREIIRTITGITPTTMRAPFGDIDNRVRAIALAMGLNAIQWTRTPAAGPFDTNGSCAFWFGGMYSVLTDGRTFLIAPLLVD